MQFYRMYAIITVRKKKEGRYVKNKASIFFEKQHNKRTL